jgi:4-hydroxy-3-methylbut-2-enyl diphosphate reductase
MKIITAEHAGFCFGVKRAVDMAFKIAEGRSNGTITLGPIIHNPQVVERLKESGVPHIDSVSELEGMKGVNTVIVRTHGIPKDDMKWLEDQGIEVIDATCPFVKKAQDYAKLLKENKYNIVILGDKEHPEVKGIVSYAGEGAVVVKEPSEYPALSGRVGIIVQTTKHMDDLKALLQVAIQNAKELRIFNTICSSTDLKLSETAELAAKVDIMIVIGGRNSANTTRLARLSKSLSVPTRHIETAEELRTEWFDGINTVGVTAGASTPDWIIDEVINRIGDIGG